MILSDHEIAAYRVEINGKLWNSFTDKQEADEAIDKLAKQGMSATLVMRARKAEHAESQR